MTKSPLLIFAVFVLFFNFSVQSSVACEAIAQTSNTAPSQSDSAREVMFHSAKPTQAPRSLGASSTPVAAQSVNSVQPRLEVSKLVGGGPSEGPLPTGLWGGNHIRMVVTEHGAELEFDCALGKIEEPLIADRAGYFEARGFYVFETGGPRSPNAPPRRRLPAIFHGWTDGTQMRLTVVLSDTGREFGPFTLELGRPPQLDKCL